MVQQDVSRNTRGVSSLLPAAGGAKQRGGVNEFYFTTLMGHATLFLHIGLNLTRGRTQLLGGKRNVPKGCPGVPGERRAEATRPLETHSPAQCRSWGPCRGGPRPLVAAVLRSPIPPPLLGPARGSGVHHPRNSPTVPPGSFPSQGAWGLSPGFTLLPDLF